MKNIVNTGLKVLLGAAVLGAAGYSIHRNFDSGRSVKFLEDRGYTDIDVDWAVIGTCSEDDRVYKYEAINSDGELERGRLCQNFWFVRRAPLTRNVIG